MPYKKETKWIAQVRVSGKRKEKIFPTRKEAVAWESAARQSPETYLEPEINTISLFDWAQAYLDFAKAKFAHVTYEEKRVMFKRFFQDVDPNLPVSDLKPGCVQTFITKQKELRSGYAANKDRKNLVAAWNWGMKYMNQTLPPPNPCSVEKMPEVRQPRYVPSAEEFWKVYEQAEGQDKVMLLAFLHLAARRGEIFKLTWQDIDFKSDRIRLWTRKRQGGDLEFDWLPLTKALKQALLWWWENRPKKDQQHVFLCLKGKPLCLKSYGKPFKYRIHFMQKLCDRAEVKPFGFHSIRHLTASTLYRLGYEVAVVQMILRHKSPSTTERYLRTLGLESVRDALEDLSAKGEVLEFTPRSIVSGKNEKAVSGAV
jgi:integrase